MANESPPETRAITDRIADAVRARGLDVTDVMSLIDMPSSTWYRRMRNPQGWTIGELDALASVLRTDRRTLTG
jgi:hypothetical protein